MVNEEMNIEHHDDVVDTMNSLKDEKGKLQNQKD